MNRRGFVALFMGFLFKPTLIAKKTYSFKDGFQKFSSGNPVPADNTAYYDTRNDDVRIDKMQAYYDECRKVEMGGLV